MTDIIKHIGESKLSDTPKKALKLKIADKAITWDMLSDVVKDIIKGGGFKIDVEANPSVIPFTDQEVVIALTATSTRGAIIAIYVDGEKKAESEVPTEKLEGELHIIPSQTSVSSMEVTADFNISGIKESATTTIHLLPPLYCGWGTSWDERVLTPKSVMSPVGEYDINIMENNSYVFFLIPEGMTINKALVGSVEFPLTDMGEIEYSGRNYEMYQSVFTYDIADITIQIE